MTQKQRSRRANALVRLEAQLKSGVKTQKGTKDVKIPLTDKDVKIPLTDKDVKRINAEIIKLKKV